ncbi:fumarylacetoacetate hydrolase family protein [Aridibaculum aurantiacum]|uniref:fumarylacetoacetate hydrolase family protein n=1 Tax=Aridibaculum aurantiacum TaxID=2810307 RepID=UPI001F6034E8|nr:fumarylacetoacetate hydrolase family protein [Aridibaculum aurantiacum]
MIRIYKTQDQIVLEQEGKYYVANETSWDRYINRDDLYQQLQEEISSLQAVGGEEWLQSQKLQAPIGSQEVWAAGVTYLRSKVARMEESEQSGGATFYDKVYDAERPEIFFKATPQRVAGTNETVRIRKDSHWDVPEPELTLVISSSGKIVGYTIGNDMSSRSIEGENPLYLPQAKMYEKCAGLGPCVLVTGNGIPATTSISMTIDRNGERMFTGSTTIDQMKRSHEELVGYLYREMEFRTGSYLMTGTCVVPPNDFTLQSTDVITISIEGIGTLVNTVA